MARDLSIIIPSFNEAAHMEKVLNDWIGVCQRLSIDFEITVYDGGSTDGTMDIVRTTMRQNSPGQLQLKVLPQIPHGPSILQDCREATSDWLFQIDSDDAYGSDAFESLWRSRRSWFLLDMEQIPVEHDELRNPEDPVRREIGRDENRTPNILRRY
jgi:glycosyltransferase involved in cell wall biosynthesis